MLAAGWPRAPLIPDLDSSASAKVLTSLGSPTARQRAKRVVSLVARTNPRVGDVMIKKILASLILITGAVVCRSESASPYTITGQPSIFWRDGQWQVFQDGQWVPYFSENKESVSAAEPAIPEPVAAPEPEAVATNDYVINYGWGYGVPLFGRSHDRHPEKFRHLRDRKHEHRPDQPQPIGGLGQTTIGIGRQSGGLGQTTIGIGQRNGLGQPTIGIGQQSGGLGQRTIGMGQPNFTVGQRNAAIGRQNAGLGQTTIGIGQPNGAIGSTTIGIGQPTIGIGQQTLSVGRTEGSHNQQGGSGRR